MTERSRLGWATEGFRGGGITIVQEFGLLEVELMPEYDVALDSNEYEVTLESEYQVTLDDNDFDVEVC